MQPPTASIRYVTGKSRTTVVITGEDSIDLMRQVMQSVRKLRGDGGSVVWVEFSIDGHTRRRYVDGSSKAKIPGT